MLREYTAAGFDTSTAAVAAAVGMPRDWGLSTQDIRNVAASLPAALRKQDDAAAVDEFGDSSDRVFIYQHQEMQVS